MHAVDAPAPCHSAVRCAVAPHAAHGHTLTLPAQQAKHFFEGEFSGCALESRMHAVDAPAPCHSALRCAVAPHAAHGHSL
jgi:hypothetical protein